MKKLISIKQFCKQNPNFMSESAIRWLIYNEHENGFDQVVRRIGRRVYIDEAEFELWVDKINDIKPENLEEKNKYDREIN